MWKRNRHTDRVTFEVVIIGCILLLYNPWIFMYITNSMRPGIDMIAISYLFYNESRKETCIDSDMHFADSCSLSLLESELFRVQLE